MLALAFLALAPTSLVIRGGTVYDGTGKVGRVADIRIVGDTIREIGRIKPRPGDQVIDARGMAVTPGFIDAHSHADGGIFDNPTAETQIRQGITTAIVGQDGGSSLPLSDFLARLKREPASLNFASFVGHGTVRKAVMGDANRKPTAAERAKMVALVDREMRAGALGLSSGLEYVPGRYADTDEMVALATTAGKRGGMYISHLRNEDNQAFAAIRELVDIARRAKIPAQISHVKLGSARVWRRAKQVTDLIDTSTRRGPSITADVYPYVYWQSTIRVLIPTEQFDDRQQWTQGLADVGGAERVLLTSFSPDPSWAGKTIAELSQQTGKDPVSVIQEIVRRCYQDGNQGSESVVVTAMNEADLTAFVRHPRTMFCSDGGLKSSHPRGAGSFPRILGVYVRERRALPLSEAIRKMTSFPADRFGLRDRGRLVRGKRADLVIFDPKTVLDTATTKDAQAKPVGINTVIVNGQPVLLNGVVTGSRPGRPLRRAG